jgi:DNA-binding HxlR family transcriptional regulator
MARERTFGCPVEVALFVLGGKWKTVLLAHLKDGPLRYRDLRARVPSLSEKMLTQRLRELEKLGLVAKLGRERGYALSARGERLRPALESLYASGRALAPEIGAKVREIEPPVRTRSRTRR